MKNFILCVLFILPFSMRLVSQQPYQWNSAEIKQKIEKLSVLGNVLYLAAHPDDENTRFISYCANERLFNTAYLSLTRGDGGQNLIGPELREELGIIRTQELLAARRVDGGKQFFTRANDFGYSKGPKETLKIWSKDKVLSDVVYVIRKFRPDVIVCRFPNDGRGGHGHHTSSALLAEEAFKLASDPMAYPEQLALVEPWSPKALYLNTGRWWNDKISAIQDSVTAINIGGYNPLLGMSYNELAAKSRTMHKSQGFGSTGYRGDYEEFFEFLQGEYNDDLIDREFQSTWKRLEGTEDIVKQLEHIKSNFDVNKPSAIVDDLFELRTLVEQIKDLHWKQIKINEIETLIIQCSGIYLEAIADNYQKSMNDSLTVSFEFIQRTKGNNIKLQSVSCARLNYTEQFQLRLSPNKRINEDRLFEVESVEVSQPYWLKKKGTMGAYDIPNQTLVGNPENAPVYIFNATLVIENHSIDHAFPLVYKSNSPIDGEQYRPFIITPKLTANFNQVNCIFSNDQFKTIALTLKAHSKVESKTLEIRTPKGWEIEYDSKVVLKNAGDEQKIGVKLKPTKRAENGSLEVLVDGELLSSMRTIEYDHIPTQVHFPKAEVSLVNMDLKTVPRKIAYLMGAGDNVPEALINIGYQVDVLEEKDIDKVPNYDVVMLGIRYLNVNNRASYIMPKLLEFCKNGGNVIVQYNTAHRLKTDVLGPYPLKLSRDRVTQENSPVEILNPKHPVLNYPNKITSNDFNGWVQERGLYFPNEWDDSYKAVLSMYDDEESPKQGSLIVAQYGEGYFTYTGLSFFRELPAGVSGAYRLLANIISLGHGR